MPLKIEDHLLWNIMKLVIIKKKQLKEKNILKQVLAGDS